MPRTSLVAIASGILAAGTLVAAHRSQAGSDQAAFELSAHAYPRVDGSTSTQPLSMLVACRVTRTSFAWRSSLFDRTRTLAPTDEPYDTGRRLSLAIDPASLPAIDSLHALAPGASLLDRVAHTGTHESYARLAQGEVDLIFVVREPTDIERREIERHGVTVAVVPIARDGFVFLRNVKNPVRTLTMEQIRDIYAGSVTDWSALGGTAGPIVAYQRDKQSGSQVEMERLIMQGRPMLDGPDIALTTSMFGPFNAIRDNERGIGYSYHYYERYMAPVPEIDTVAIAGVKPDAATIASGRYALTTFVYLAYRSDLPAESSAARLRDWLTTPGGQAVVAESGYVPLRSTGR